MRSIYKFISLVNTVSLEVATKQVLKTKFKERILQMALIL